MFLFAVISYVSLYLGLAFCALCLATGLYYLAELAEEFTTTTRKILKYIVITVIIIHILLIVFENFPFFITMVGLLSHVVYYQFLKTFPTFQILSPTFILSCVMFILSHITWYWHFTDYRTYHYDFYQLLGFFFGCVWLTPCGFFITLSVNDLSLPGLGSIESRKSVDITGKKRRKNLLSFIRSLFGGNNDTLPHTNRGHVL